MCPLQLHGERGLHEAPDDFLFVGVDDTGHEELRRGHETFGLGGCAVPVGLYPTIVREPWQSLSKKYFGGLPMHAAEMCKPTPEQSIAIGGFFRTHGFGRIAVVMSPRTLRGPDLPPYQLVARLFLERIKRLTELFGCKGIVLVLEESQRGDRLAARYFEGYNLQQQVGNDAINLPFYKFRMPKSACEPLLEVSDFIIHTAGSQVRSVHDGKDWNARRDFEAVFRSNDQTLSEFFELTSAGN